MSFGTGAGKGSLPRHVDGEKFRDNYDRIFGSRDRQRQTEPTKEQRSWSPEFLRECERVGFDTYEHVPKQQ